MLVCNFVYVRVKENELKHGKFYIMIRHIKNTSNKNPICRNAKQFLNTLFNFMSNIYTFFEIISTDGLILEEKSNFLT